MVANSDCEKAQVNCYLGGDGWQFEHLIRDAILLWHTSELRITSGASVIIKNVLPFLILEP